MTVRSGLEMFVADGASALRGKRVGLCCNHTAVDRELRHAIDLLTDAGLDLVRLFGPEHGVRATAQDMVGVGDSIDPASGAEVVSLYGQDEASLRPRPEHLDGLDVLLFDIQDIGTRYYTYQATLGYLMEACGPRGIRVVVLDRPNPIRGTVVEGNLVQPGCESFVSAYPMAVRHGMTMGELGVWFRDHLGVDCELDVVPCRGWRRDMWFDETGLPWVYPSPNMPTLDTAVVYPGMCLFEATNLSEGRGTTRPFHLVGAPWIDPEAMAVACRRIAAESGLQGVAFRPATFLPGFQKHAGTNCHGVEVFVTERNALHAFKLGLVVLEAAWKTGGDGFRWRAEPYEFIDDVPAIDLLTGSHEARELLESGGSPWKLLEHWELQRQAFLGSRTPCLQYGDGI